MAAAEVLVFPESWRRSARGHFSRTGLDEWSLQNQLSLISKAWLYRIGQNATLPFSSSHSPTSRPDFAPDWRLREPTLFPSQPSASGSSHGIQETNELPEYAHRSGPLSAEQCPLTDSRNKEDEDFNTEKDSLPDPTLHPSVDFSSPVGVIEFKGGKKKNKANKNSNSNNNNNNKDAGNNPDNDDGGDKNEGEDETNNGGGDDQSGAGAGGDGGAGANDSPSNGDNSGGNDSKESGDDNRDVNNADGGDGTMKTEEEVNPDEFFNFVTKSRKKKGKKEPLNAEPNLAPQIPATSSGGDSFQEIKLGGDKGNKLDIDFGSKNDKDDFGSFGAKWNTGGTSAWNFGATSNEGADAGADTKKEAHNSNPWSTNIAKTKKSTKTGFTFGALSEETNDNSEVLDGTNDNDWDISAVGKKNKKKNNAAVGGLDNFAGGKDESAKTSADPWGWKAGKNQGSPDEPDPKPASEAAVHADDDWLSTSKKDQKKKKKISAVDAEESATKAGKVADEATPKIEDSVWTTSGTGKNNKKGKKDGSQGEQTSIPESAKEANPEPEKGDIDIWDIGTSSGIKDKNKTMSTSWGDLDFAAVSVDGEDSTGRPPTDQNDDGQGIWGITGASKKNKKAKNSDATTNAYETELAAKAIIELDTKEEGSWWTMNTSAKERRKNKKKGAVNEAQDAKPSSLADPDPDPLAESDSKTDAKKDSEDTPKKGKNKKKQNTLEHGQGDFGALEPVEPAGEKWDTWTMEKNKRENGGQKEDQLQLGDAGTEVKDDGEWPLGREEENPKGTQDSWMTSTNNEKKKKKDKKKDKGAADQLNSDVQDKGSSAKNTSKELADSTKDDDFANAWGSGDQWKEQELSVTSAKVDGLEEPADDLWAAVTNKDKKKKNKLDDDAVKIGTDTAGKKPQLIVERLNMTEFREQTGENKDDLWNEADSAKSSSKSKQSEAEKNSEEEKLKKGKESKLSEKELKKIEKEKKKAEKAEKARLEQEAADQKAQELDARQEDEQAQLEEENKIRLKEEARLAAEATAIAKEEEQLATLETKLVLKGKLGKKEMDKYNRLKEIVGKRAEKAEIEAQEEATGQATPEAEGEASRGAEAEPVRKAEEAEAAETSSKRSLKKDKDKKKDKSSSKDLELEPQGEQELQLDLGSNDVEEFLSPQDKPTNNAFNFWGIGSGPKKAKKDGIDANDTTSPPKLSETAAVKGPSARKAVGGKVADRRKTFETAQEETLAQFVPPPPPLPPAPPTPPQEEKKSSKSSSKKKKLREVEETEQQSSSSNQSLKSSEIPGSFPADEDEDAEVNIVDTTLEEKSDDGKEGKKKNEARVVPPPVPDAPLTPPPEPKLSKKNRPKINGEGAAWARWSAATTGQKEENKDEKSAARTSSKSKSDKASRAPPDKVSVKDSGSDKTDRAEKSDKVTSKARMPSMLMSTPPISRSMSTRDKARVNGTSGRSSSRRHSLDARDAALPPPEAMPEMTAKAAKILGIEKASRKEKPRRASEYGDSFMAGALGSDANVNAAKREKHRSRKLSDDDAIKLDVAPASDTPVKRNMSSSKKSGFSGLFSGLMTPKSVKADPFSDVDVTAGEADREARNSTRKSRRSEREQIDNRRRHEEDPEARRLEEKAARKTERQAARQRAEDERQALQDRDARRIERRRLRKEQEAAALADEARRASKAERRRSQTQPTEPIEDEEERRRRREERRAARVSEGLADQKRKSGRRYTDASGDEQVNAHKDRKRDSRKGSVWPHSGTSSWVKEHSDAPPPPPDDSVPTDEEQARREARRARRRAKQGEVTADETDDQRRRRARREDRDNARRVAGSDGSDERQQGRRSSNLVNPTPRTSWWRKLTS